jgi:hypothetical protein
VEQAVEWKMRIDVASKNEGFRLSLGGNAIGHDEWIETSKFTNVNQSESRICRDALKNHAMAISLFPYL